MYFSLEDAGENLGRKGDTYKECSAKYENLKEQVSGADIGKLREFCLEYRNRDLEYRRSNLLFSLGYTKEEYEAYLKERNAKRNEKKQRKRGK